MTVVRSSSGDAIRHVDLVDRSEMAEAMNEGLSIAPDRTAVITIDLQRGALDPDIATLPIPEPERTRVVEGSARLVTWARESGITVVHVVTHRHPREIAAQPFARAAAVAGHSLSPGAASDFANHKVTGSTGAQLMPELGPEPGDIVVDSKRRFDIFYGTNLEVLLRALGTTTLVIGGVNTNTCVQASVFGAYARDLRAVVVSDAVASTYGEDLHVLALENIRRRLGWVLTLDELRGKLVDQTGDPDARLHAPSP